MRTKKKKTRKVKRRTAMELHTQRFENSPLGGLIMHGGGRFPRGVNHGYKFDVERKFKPVIGGTKVERNSFFPINPMTGFMTQGQPSATIYADMFRESRNAITSAIREGLTAQKPLIPQIINTQSQTDAVDISQQEKELISLKEGIEGKKQTAREYQRTRRKKIKESKEALRSAFFMQEQGAGAAGSGGSDADTERLIGSSEEEYRELFKGSLDMPVFR